MGTAGSGVAVLLYQDQWSNQGQNTVSRVVLSEHSRVVGFNSDVDCRSARRVNTKQAASSGLHELNQTMAMLALPPPAQLRTLLHAPPSSDTTAVVEDNLESSSTSFFLTDIAVEGSC
jgi:hypothetical protein